MGNFLHDFVSGAEHSDITAVEQSLAIKFPEDLVAFWNKHQGGWPENDIFDYTDMYGVASDGQVISFLLLNKQEGEMVRQTLSFRKEGRVLDCHVVIADEAGGAQDIVQQ